MISPLTFIFSPPASCSNRRGFTLVEMIVALMIFSIVAVVAIGALVKIISANKKAQTLQSAITNLNFALETMSREMRVGANYYCSSGTSFSASSLPANSPGPCAPNGMSDPNGATIAFVSTKRISGEACNLIYAYEIKPVNGGFELNKARQTSCNSPIYSVDPIVDPNVIITSYYIKMTEQATPYPMVLIRLSGYSGVKEREKTFFDVQTAVSARTI